ncbi:MAG: c-type cytochrome [Thermoleophilia bacterium]|nr:c-type cytochrome [Thermoleophilia bacterium]
MRRPALAAILLALSLALLAGGCLGGEEVGAGPETDDGSVQPGTTDTEKLPALVLTGVAASGEAIFGTQGCAACHALAAAGAIGTIGPNLDDSKPTFEFAVERITLGQGGMPSFGDKLEPQQIADVAAFVAESAG